MTVILRFGKVHSPKLVTGYNDKRLEDDAWRHIIVFAYLLLHK